MLTSVPPATLITFNSGNLNPLSYSLNHLKCSTYCGKAKEVRKENPSMVAH